MPLSFLVLIAAVMSVQSLLEGPGRRRKDTRVGCCRIWSSVEEFLQIGNSMDESLRRVQTPADCGQASEDGESGLSGQKWMLFSHAFLRVGEGHSTGLQLGWLPRHQAGKRVGNWLCGPQSSPGERTWSQEVCYLETGRQCLCRVPVSQGFCRCSSLSCR